MPVKLHCFCTYREKLAVLPKAVNTQENFKCVAQADRENHWVLLKDEEKTVGFILRVFWGERGKWEWMGYQSSLGHT